MIIVKIMYYGNKKIQNKIQMAKNELTNRNNLQVYGKSCAYKLNRFTGIPMGLTFTTAKKIDIGKCING